MPHTDLFPRILLPKYVDQDSEFEWLLCLASGLQTADGQKTCDSRKIKEPSTLRSCPEWIM